MDKHRQSRDPRRGGRASGQHPARTHDGSRAALPDEAPIGPGDLEIEFVGEGFVPDHA